MARYNSQYISALSAAALVALRDQLAAEGVRTRTPHPDLQMVAGALKARTGWRCKKGGSGPLTEQEAGARIEAAQGWLDLHPLKDAAPKRYFFDSLRTAAQDHGLGGKDVTWDVSRAEPRHMALRRKADGQLLGSLWVPRPEKGSIGSGRSPAEEAARVREAQARASRRGKPARAEVRVVSPAPASLAADAPVPQVGPRAKAATNVVLAVEERLVRPTAMDKTEELRAEQQARRDREAALRQARKAAAEERKAAAEERKAAASRGAKRHKGQSVSQSVSRPAAQPTAAQPTSRPAGRAKSARGKVSPRQKAVAGGMPVTPLGVKVYQATAEATYEWLEVEAMAQAAQALIELESELETRPSALELMALGSLAELYGDDRGEPLDEDQEAALELLAAGEQYLREDLGPLPRHYGAVGAETARGKEPERAMSRRAFEPAAMPQPPASRLADTEPGKTEPTQKGGYTLKLAPVRRGGVYFF